MDESAIYFESSLRHLMIRRAEETGKDVSQLDVSRKTGLSYPTVQRWYHGELRHIEAETVKAFMDYFDCRMSDLVKVKS